MEKNVAVRVDNVGMRFQLNQERVDNLKEYVIKFLRRDLKYNEFWALKEVDFEIKKGRNFLNVKFKAITVLGEVEIETEAVKIV